MFNIHRRRSTPRHSRRTLGTVATSALLLGLLASPALGSGTDTDPPPEDPPPTTTEQPDAEPVLATDAQADGSGGTGAVPVNSNPQSGCAFETFPDGFRYSDISITEQNGNRRNIESVSQDTAEGIIEIGNNTEETEAPAGSNTNRPTEIDSTTHEIEDGGFLEGDGVKWNVWKITCNPDEPLDFTVVAAPEQAIGLLPDLYNYIEAALPAPELELTPEDPDGFTYVQVPIDFRTADPIEPITITADTGGPPEIRAWSVMTATPEIVTFDSGDTETDPQAVQCSIAAATAPYNPDQPGECSYTFRNSSTISDNNVFDAEFSITWTITFYDSDGTTGTQPPLTSTQNEEVAVGEIKAVNTYN